MGIESALCLVLVHTVDSVSGNNLSWQKRWLDKGDPAVAYVSVVKLVSGGLSPGGSNF